MLMRAIATQLYSTNRAEDPRLKGIKGLVAGIAFSALARRTPVGAALVAGALIARRFYKAGQKAQAERDGPQAALALPAPVQPDQSGHLRESPGVVVATPRPVEKHEKVSPRKTRSATLH